MQSRFNQVLHHLIKEIDSAQPRIAIAFSGGLDSSALLHLCTQYANQHPSQLTAFHIHHGISANADQWAQHCQQQCAEWNLPFEAAYIQLNNVNQHGIEAAARHQRYAALGEMCQRHQIDILLTAHHQDDQAETLLLHLLRGTGVAGLGGMRSLQHAAELLKNSAVWLARPLLDFTRVELENYVQQHQIRFIVDDSNVDTRYTRNQLRHHFMPLLERDFPGYQTRLARTAQHLQSAQDLLDQIAAHDYEYVKERGDALSIPRLTQLTEARIDQVLRYWLMKNRHTMPDTARLVEIRKQLLHARDDAQVCVKYGSVELHRYRQHVSMAQVMPLVTGGYDFVWKGEARLDFPAWCGTLFFDPADPGQPSICHSWLLQKGLQLRPRQGGERLKLAANRHTRDLKSHYQTLGIPYWQRSRLPLVFVGDALLFAAGIGTQSEFLTKAEQGVTLRWEGS